MDFQSRYKADANQSMGLRFIKVYNMWHARIQSVLKPFQLMHSQFVVLAAVAYLTQKQPEVMQVMLADYLFMEPMAVSQMCKKLVQLEYITRISHSTDTRAKVVKLTSRGEQVLNEAVLLVEEIDHAFFGVLTLQQQQQLTVLLAQLLGENRT